MSCAPDLEREAAAAQATIAAQQASTALSNVNQIEGFDPKAQHGIGSASTCPSCQAQLAPGAKFCAGCGKSVVAAHAFCTGCGTQLVAGAKFCSGCGTPSAG
jgi:predicted amidophosphoribosyltransferase